MSEQVPRPSHWITVGTIVVAIAVVLAVLYFIPGHSKPSGGMMSAPPSCRAADPSVSDATAVHGLFVINPQSKPNQPYYEDTLAYLQNNSVVCGADFLVHWSRIDLGPTSSPQYNWTWLDREIFPWTQAGREVNLNVMTVGYGPNLTFVPAYVLSQVPTVQCDDNSITPLFWNATFRVSYQNFIRAAVEHFETLPGIGYIRFGLGTGSDTAPLYDAAAPGCNAVLNSTGFTPAIWTSYLGKMLNFEESLNSSIPLMVGLNAIENGLKGYTFADIASQTAARAVSDGIAIGYEGLGLAGVQYNPSGGAIPCSTWCTQFDLYQGLIPLELQTATFSSPNGSGPVGSLVTLLPYGLSQHAQIFELYWEDWLTAFDPNYPAYAQYHVPYGAILNNTAQIVGISP